MKHYILVRRTGDDVSTITAIGKTYTSAERAAGAAGEDLMEHGRTPGQAGDFALDLASRPVGSVMLNPATNFNYRVLEADFTSNRRPIVPGLRVLDYDRREGTVTAPQFMDDGMMTPGGEYFEGWYDVLPDGRAGRGKSFNGERMRAL